MSRLTCVVAVLAVLATLTSPSLSAEGGAAAPTPKSVRISYAKSPFNLPLIVARRLGMLETAFGAKGIAVEYAEIDSGAKQAEAMAALSIDIAGVINTTSVIIAAAAGNDLKIVSGFSRPSGLFAIVVDDPAIRTVADLKGKRVAGPKGTVLHQLLMAALARAGLGMGDVQFVQMDIPAAQTALLSRQVDAGLLAASAVVAAQSAGARVLVTAEGYLEPQLVTAVRGAFLRDYPSLVDLYVSVIGKAEDWIAAHEDEALALGAKEQGIGVAEARRLAAASHFSPSIGPAEIEALESDAKFLLDSGMLARPFDPRSILAAIQ